MSIAGVSGIGSPSSKMQSISGNASVPAASNENVGSPSIPAEPTQVIILEFTFKGTGGFSSSIFN